MSDLRKETTPLVSLYPRDVAHSVEISLVAEGLSRRISEERHNSSIDDSVRKFFQEHKLEADEESIKVIISKIRELISADQVYDSEMAQAYRASLPVLLEIMPITATLGYPTYQTIQITGWLSGQEVTNKNFRYTLTGRACSRCRVNPEIQGVTGSGVACLDQESCGWNFCY